MSQRIAVYRYQGSLSLAEVRAGQPPVCWVVAPDNARLISGRTGSVAVCLPAIGKLSEPLYLSGTNLVFAAKKGEHQLVYHGSDPGPEAGPVLSSGAWR